MWKGAHKAISLRTLVLGTRDQEGRDQKVVSSKSSVSELYQFDTIRSSWSHVSKAETVSGISDTQIFMAQERQGKERSLSLLLAHTWILPRTSRPSTKFALFSTNTSAGQVSLHSLILYIQTFHLLFYLLGKAISDPQEPELRLFPCVKFLLYVLFTQFAI